MSVKEAALMQIPDLLSRLGTSRETGLSDTDVELRRRQYGLNEMQIHEEEPLLIKYIGQFKDPMILLLLASALISLITREFDDALSITVAILIVVTVGFVQEYRSEKSLQALTQLIPPKCNCIRNGVMQEMLARYLVPGDIVHISVGDRVPADIRLIESVELEIDESSFTGETTHFQKQSQVIENPNSLLLNNISFMGTFVCSGHGKGVVVSVGENSEFGQVFKMMQSEEAPKTPLQKSMDSLGKQLSFYSLCIIGCILLAGWIQGRNILNIFTIGVSLAVAAIPEGLPIVVTVTLALGVIRMANKNAIVKKLPVVETLGCVDVICSDKTGTLTQNKMEVTQIYTDRRRSAQVFDDDVVCEGESVTCDTHKDIFDTIEIGCVCNNAQFRDNTFKGQPTETALLSLGSKLNLFNLRDEFHRVDERSFSSEQKWMAVLVQRKCPTIDNDNEGVWFMKGALSVVLRHCTVIGQNHAPFTTKEKAHFEGVSAEMGHQGLRVIAFASGRSLMGMRFLGLVGLCDLPRVGVASAVSELMRGGVEVKMITGDALETAVSIAESLGIYTPGSLSLSGAELDQLGSSPQELASSVDRTSVFYRVTPKHKVIIVKALQHKKRIVGMTGDGTNDAVALKRAEIGIAMGTAGTDVCKEAADMILTDDNFSTILSAVEEGKGIYYNIRNFVRFQLSTSVAALSLVSLSTLFGLPNPLNAMQILWINIIMDGPPAQSLGVEPVDRDVMKQPPRKASDQMISLSLLARVLLSAVIILLGTFWIFWREFQDEIVTPRDTTMTFTCFVLFDMFNALSCRSMTKSVLSLGLFTNRALSYSIGGCLLCQLLVIYFGPLQSIFQTESLSFLDIMLLLGLCSSVLLVDEVYKACYRRWGSINSQMHSSRTFNIQVV